MRKALPPPPPVSFWDPQTWPAPHDMAGLLMERSMIVAIAVVLLPFLVLGLRSFLRSFITAGRHATAAAQASSSKNTKDDEDEDEDIPIFRLALARLRSMRFSPGELVASVVAQLGQTAFLITSSFVAVVAVTLQTLSHRSRALRGDTVARQIEAQANGLLAKAKAQVESFSIHAMARKAFKDADISGDGSVNAGEVYAAVLSLYLQIGMLAKVTPPARAHVLKLASRFDMDGSGELGEEEFVLFVTVLFENVAARVAAQVSLAGLISPYLSGKVTAYGSEMTELKAAAMRMIPQARPRAPTCCPRSGLPSALSTCGVSSSSPPAFYIHAIPPTMASDALAPASMRRPLL